MRKEGDIGRPDAAIARIAARQHGVVASAQLLAAGISTSGVQRRVTASRLHRLHRGVYAVGHRALSDEGRWMAAVLASGEGAALSHLSAAELWGIRSRFRRQSVTGGRGEAMIVDVTAPGTAGKRTRHGIRLHRSTTLTAKECTWRGGIPVTTPARTLADLRSVVSAAEFAKAVREAEFLRLPVGAGLETDNARTELESRFLALCRRHRLPQPAVNVRVDRYEVDFLWCAERLIVEVDGWESHRTRSAFEADRARDARLALLGYEVLRFTWRQVGSERRRITRTIRTLLRARS